MTRKSLAALPYLSRFSPSRIQPVALLVVGYLAAWWRLLDLTPGKFWDEWTLHKVPGEILIANFTDAGYPWLAWFFLFPLGIQEYRILIFLLLLVVNLLFLEILRATPGIGERTALLAASVAAVLPIFEARVSFAQLPSLVPLVIFMFAWTFGLRSGLLRNHREQLFLLLLVGLSAFLYPAFSFLSAGLALHLAAVHLTRSGRTSARKLSFWIVLPIAAFAATLLRRVFFPSRNSYDNYQTILWDSYLVIFFLVTGVFGLLAVFILLGVPDVNQFRDVAFLIVSGCFVFLMALAPYILQGTRLPFDEWASRYEINFFLGIGFILSGGVRLLLSFARRLPITALAILAVVFGVSEANSIMARAESQMQKQVALSQLFAQNTELLRGSFLVVIDGTSNENLFVGQLRPYEWSSWISQAIGTRDVLAVEVSNLDEVGSVVKEYQSGQWDDYGESYDYWWSQHDAGGAVQVLTISRDNIATSNGRYSLSIDRWPDK